MMYRDSFYDHGDEDKPGLSLPGRWLVIINALAIERPPAVGSRGTEAVRGPQENLAVTHMRRRGGQEGCDGRGGCEGARGLKEVAEMMRIIK